MMKQVRIFKAIAVIVLVVLVGFAIKSLLFSNYVVDGKSMEPTLEDGNLMMVNKVVYELTDVHRFDIIVFHANEQEDYVKRVIGLPGDEIEYRNDRLYINGQYIEEDFLDSYKEKNHQGRYTEDFTLQELTGNKRVPAGNYFVMGDNRIDSLDSRSFGFINTDAIVGKVDLAYWPNQKSQATFGK